MERTSVVVFVSGPSKRPKNGMAVQPLRHQVDAAVPATDRPP